MKIQYCSCVCGCKDISHDMICDLCKARLCDFVFIKKREKIPSLNLINKKYLKKYWIFVKRNACILNEFQCNQQT